MSDQVYVGIDVSGDRLDVHVLPEGKAFSGKNNARGISGLIKRLRSKPPTVIVMESSGSVEVTLTIKLAEAGLPFAVVNPKQVRDFAKGIGKLAKTDRVDAYVLARFAQTNHPTPQSLPSEEERIMKDLVRRRQQLIDMRTGEKNRLHRANSQPVRESVLSVIRILDQQIQDIDRDLDQMLESLPDMRQKEALLESFKGIGSVIARNLAVLMPELGTGNRQQIGALAGLAPINQDSGKRRGKRMIAGGRADVRKNLYMAAISAKQHNNVIKRFYDRLIEAGKPPKVALTACMRKILVILNTMLKTKHPFAEVFS